MPHVDFELGFEYHNLTQGKWFVEDYTDTQIGAGKLAQYDTKKTAKKRAKGYAQQAANQLNRPVNLYIYTKSGKLQTVDVFDPV